ncbi:MAG: dihydroorotate dehydrogenase electron transfer subunit [Coriobacteriia bacterium]|nr:dihydroorotate dehydrogenase electron transfer subunit [Coriobacteriia bacterium]
MSGSLPAEVPVPPAAAAPGIEKVRITEHEQLADGIWRLLLQAPRCAATILPGQFVHLRITRADDHVLRRPFSVHRVRGRCIEILYQVVGRGTGLLSALPVGEERMDIVGPLGKGWQIPTHAKSLLLVGGGLGAAPLGMLAEQLASQGRHVEVALGGASADRLIALELFRRLADRVEVATDDGSLGHQGFVTVLAERMLAEAGFDAVFCCGPEPMQRLVARHAKTLGVPCQASLERLMACGIGACFSCIVPTRSGQMRACVDGPVFDAEEVCWGDS